MLYRGCLVPNNPKRQHHITPRVYLEGFASKEQPTVVYVFEKARGPRPLPIPVTGVQKDYYAVTRDDGTKDTQTVEDYLAHEIESPANPIIRKIRDRQMPEASEKLVLARYISAMMTRVPQHRARQRKTTKTVAEQEKAKWQEAIDQAIVENPAMEEKLQRLRFEALRHIDKFSSDPPDSLFANSIMDADKYASKIHNMKWVFFITKTRQGFITSDNPVFFFESIGLVGRDDYEGYGEISFPISREIALWASWQQKEERFLLVNEHLVREINNRTASTAQRYLYYSTSARWVDALAKRNKEDIHLNRIILS